MSKATKVKHVHREVLEDFNLPEPPQSIVKVAAGRGNNLHEVVNEAGERFLASMPTKFRRNVWVKRGDFVVIEPISEGDKVKAEIVSILYKEQIKYIKEEGKWPKAFDKTGSNAHPTRQQERDEQEAPAGAVGDEEEVDSEQEEEDNDDDLFVNTNRVQVAYEESEEDDSDDDDSDESDEDEEEVEEENSSPDKNSVCSDGE